MSIGVFSIVLNLVCFALVCYLMPEMSVMSFMFMVLVVPLIYNWFICVKVKSNMKKEIKITLLSVVTAVSYYVSGAVLEKTEKIAAFISQNEFNTGTIVINISEDMFSVSQLVFILILQFFVLYFVSCLSDRGKKNDRS